jgi:prephenate dehydratase/chorismate mutase/prephenate dehydratase
VISPERLRVAFQGELGAYSEDAIQLLYGASSEAVPFASFGDAVNAVLDGGADRILLPIENTLVGSVGEAHDIIDRTPELHAVGETVVEVHHCLMAPHGASVDTIATVLSHHVALAQCQEFFRTHRRMETHGVFDTAGAAREVAQLGDPSFGAVAGRAAAGRYALDVIVADIEDRHDNQTRFVALARDPIMPDAGTPVRTMIVFTTNDKPGALLLGLQPFADNGVNLRRIDTRPTGEPWTYRFFVEFDHEVGNSHVDAALSDVERATAAMRIIGTFPRWNAGRRRSIGWTPMDIPIIA